MNQADCNITATPQQATRPYTSKLV